MVNMETVRFIEKLNDLAHKTTIGFADYYKIRESAADFGGVLYDSKHDNRVILNFLSNIHHDLLVYYDENTEYKIRAEVSGGPFDCFVEVIFHDSDDSDFMFIVENGRWYSV